MFSEVSVPQLNLFKVGVGHYQEGALFALVFVVCMGYQEAGVQCRGLEITCLLFAEDVGIVLHVRIYSP